MLGQDLSMQLVKERERQGPTDADLDALFGTPSHGPTASSSAVDKSDTSHGTKPHGADQTVSASTSAAAPASELMHKEFGYAVLGGYIPSKVAPDQPSAATAFTFQAQPRLHPRRMFAPGQSYQPSVS